MHPLGFYFKSGTLAVLIFCLLGGLGSFSLWGQSGRVDSASFWEPVQIDEVVILASGDNFDVKAFIDRIRKDTTFYKAFKTMRLVTFNAENDMWVYDKSGKKVVARLDSETKQIYRDGCRSMRTLEEEVQGNFYKSNGDYRYFTAEMYAQLFFTEGQVCGEDNIVGNSLDALKVKGNRIEKSKAQLKQLLFNPGSRVSGIPFVGDKVALFEPGIAKMYDFRISVEQKNGHACYLFEATPKPDFKEEVIIRVFRTWLKQTDYAIIARDYSLRCNTLLFDFDVDMKVSLRQVGDRLLPARIDYDGNWDIPTKRREIVRFSAVFDY